MRLAGELTILTAAERHRELVSFLDGAGPKEIDLSAVTELDTAGLQLLVMARREAAQRGVDLRLCEPAGAVSAVLSLADLDNYLRGDGTAEGREADR